MLKRYSSDNINDTKIPSFFFRKLQLVTALLLICESSAKCMDTLTLKRHNSFQN